MRRLMVLVVLALVVGMLPAFAADGTEPDLSWAHNLGGTSPDTGNDVAVDTSGNVYVTGHFQGADADFDPGAGTHLLASNGSTDMFVAKYDASGALVWAHGIGGSGFDMGLGVAVDGSGNVYVTGFFSDTDVDFDPGAGIHLLTNNGNRDVFVAKYDTSGALVWAHGIGGSDFDEGHGVAVDGSGNVYVTGSFSDTDVDFDPGADTHILTNNGSDDMFVAKYDASGALVWAHNTDGSGREEGHGVAVDASGNVYVTGSFEGVDADFDPGAGTHEHTSNGSADMFVAKYDTSGGFEWAHGIGGSGFDPGFGVAVDASGNVYVTGNFSGADVDFDPGAGTHLLTSNGSADMFVAKYDTSGALEWAHNTGGSRSDTGLGVAVDASDNVYVTGFFEGADGDFDPGAGTHLLTSNGSRDVFVAKYDTSGGFEWAHGIGGSDSDLGLGVAVGASGNMYITGSFSGTDADFDPDAGTHLLTSNGSTDVFVTKLAVDLTDPAVAITTPADGDSYELDAVVAADFGCSDDESGIASCVGTVADGNPIDTSTLGDHTFTVTATDRAGNTTTLTHTYSVVEVPSVIRYAGPDRFGTAAAIAQGDFPTPGLVDTVFVAVGTNFPDAVAGAAVAAEEGASLLLVNTNSIPSDVIDELVRLGPDTIVILGGNAVISPDVEIALGTYAPTVIRLAGVNRYATAVEISKHGFPGGADEVFVATGTGYADALAAGPAAAVLGGPVLLTAPDSLPQVVADEIARLGPDRIVVVGGTAAVASTVFAQLQAIQPNTVRLSGPNRYATAVAISLDTFAGDADRTYVATGLNFPDALAGAAAAGWYSSPIMHVLATSIPAVVVDEITRLAPTTIVVLGGTAVVSQTVEDQLEALLP